MKLIRPYAKFVSNKPSIMLLIVILLTLFAFSLSQNVGTVSSDNKDTLPDDIPVIQAFNIIEDNFGGSDSIMIAVEINPQIRASNEVRDIREPEVMKYLYLLTKLSEHTTDVISASSAGTIIKDLNGGILPKSKRRVIELTEGNMLFDSYISSDYTLALINIRLTDTYDEEKIVNDLQDVISQVPMPPGVISNVAGSVAEGPVMQQTIGPDMARTSNVSIVGILIVLFLVFFSVRYALTPLIVIGIGIVWAFGYFGLVGINISPMTSGAISMIMGIGIDFGIQTITRFRDELKINKPAKAMEETIVSVFKPMFTTTLAALIGFKAMSMGDLTVLQELATIMSYGVLFCFLSALTVVPVLSVLGENLINKFKRGKKK